MKSEKKRFRDYNFTDTTTLPSASDPVSLNFRELVYKVSF
jgi:hypothetical protein